MDKSEDPANDLATSKSDYVASAAKAALGVIPFAGSLLAEIAGAVIPNQRIDRIVSFAAELEKRIGDLERQRALQNISNEEFTDLVEEGLRQAARSTTDERRAHIANLVANSLTDEEISFAQAKHLLRILGEINDAEVIWLRSYLDPTIGGDKEFREKHRAVLNPVSATFSSQPAELDQATIQESYKEHLAQLALLESRFRIDNKTKLPEFDSRGRPKSAGYDLTSLGRLLLRELGFKDPFSGAEP